MHVNACECMKTCVLREPQTGSRDARLWQAHTTRTATALQPSADHHSRGTPEVISAVHLIALSLHPRTHCFVLAPFAASSRRACDMHVTWL